MPTSTAAAAGAAASPSPSRRRRGRPMRITTPTQADVNDDVISQAIGEARSRSVSVSPSKMRRQQRQTADAVRAAGAAGAAASPPAGTAGELAGSPGGSSTRLAVRPMLSADRSHHQMFGVRAIQQDLSKARNKSQQIAVLVQYQEALSDIQLSAADAIAPNQLEKDLRREPIKVNGTLVRDHCLETGNLGILTDEISRALVRMTPLSRTARRRALGAILRACCRTNSGGDSYFVLASLFEAADVLVTPAHGRVARPIDVTVEAAVATVRMHNCYQVQNVEYIGVESAQADREKTIYDTVVVETLEFLPHSIGSDDDEEEDDSGGDGNGGGGGGGGAEHEPVSQRILCISSNDFYVSPLPSAPRSKKFSFTNDKKLEDMDVLDSRPRHSSSSSSHSHSPPPPRGAAGAQPDELPHRRNDSGSGSPASTQGKQMLHSAFDGRRQQQQQQQAAVVAASGGLARGRSRGAVEFAELTEQQQEQLLPRLFSGLSLDTDNNGGSRRRRRRHHRNGGAGGGGAAATDVDDDNDNDDAAGGGASDSLDEEVFNFTDSDSTSPSKAPGVSSSSSAAAGTSGAPWGAAGGERGEAHKRDHRANRTSAHPVKTRGRGSGRRGNAAAAAAAATASSPLFHASPSASPSLRRQLQQWAAVGNGAVALHKRRRRSPSPRAARMIGRSPQRRAQRGQRSPAHGGAGNGLAAMSPASRHLRKMMAYPHVPTGSAASPGSVGPASVSPVHRRPPSTDGGGGGGGASTAASPGAYSYSSWRSQSPRRRASGPNRPRVHLHEHQPLVSPQPAAHHDEAVSSPSRSSSPRLQQQQQHGHGHDHASPVVVVMEHDESSVLVCPECHQRCGTLLTFMRHWGRLHVAQLAAAAAEMGSGEPHQHRHQHQHQHQHQHEYWDAQRREDYDQYQYPSQAYGAGGAGDDGEDSTATGSELRTGRSPLTARSQLATARSQQTAAAAAAAATSPLTPVVLGWQASEGSSGDASRGARGGGVGGGDGRSPRRRRGSSSRSPRRPGHRSHANGSPTRLPPPAGVYEDDDEFDDSDDEFDVPPPPPTDDEGGRLATAAAANTTAAPAAAGHERDDSYRNVDNDFDRRHHHDSHDHDHHRHAGKHDGANDMMRHHEQTLLDPDLPPRVGLDTSTAKSYWDPKQQAFYMVDPVTGESWWV